ncbi:unnamed protein product [Urochloa humidicola]
MSKTFRKLSMDTKFKDAAAFFEMDVDNFQDLAREYKLDVYPAFLLLNPKENYKEVGSRVTGINPGKLQSSIEEALTQLRARAPPAPAPTQPRAPPAPPRRIPWADDEAEQDSFGRSIIIWAANNRPEYKPVYNPGRRRRRYYHYF